MCCRDIIYIYIYIYIYTCMQYLLSIYKNSCRVVLINVVLKGATKFYSTHYSCVVIILVILRVYKSLHFLLILSEIYFFAFLSFLCFLLVLCVKFDVSFINFLTLHNYHLHSSMCQVSWYFFCHLFETIC